MQRPPSISLAKKVDFKITNVGMFAHVPNDAIQIIANYLTGGDVANWRLAARYFAGHGRLKTFLQIAQRKCRVYAQEENIYFLFDDGRLFFLDAARSQFGQISFPQNAAVTTVAFGSNHALVLTTNGLCYGWGVRKYLGIPTTRRHKEPVIPHTQPALVQLSGNKKIVKIVAGANQSFVANERGEWFACGENNKGQLGLGDHDDHSSFAPLSLFHPGRIITAVFPSPQTTYILDQYGIAYSAGRANRASNFGCHFIKLHDITDSKISNIAVGDQHAVFLADKNEIYVRGEFHHGQLAVFPNNRYRVFRLNITLNTPCIDIAAGYRRSFFMTETQCLATGLNDNGELGAETTMQLTHGEQGWVALPANERVAKLSAGKGFTLFQSATGNHYISDIHGAKPKQIDPAKSRAEFYKPKSSR